MTTRTDERYQRIIGGAPELGGDRIREILAGRFGLRGGTIQPLAGETERNTHIRERAGNGYVLKVADATKRPVSFTAEHADEFTATLDHVLAVSW